jgi:hypothetical protein
VHSLLEARACTVVGAYRTSHFSFIQIQTSPEQ